MIPLDEEMRKYKQGNHGPLARCPRCATDWLPLDEWNSPKLQLVPARAAPPIHVMAGDHTLEFREDGLAYCSVCKGGEIELEESCSSRMARRVGVMKRVDTPAIWAAFRANMETLKRHAEALVITDVSQKAEMARAREIRLALKEIRVAVEHKRKELVADLKKQSGSIDADARGIRVTIEGLEARLEQQEQFEALQLANAKMRLQQEREDMLRPYVSEADLLELAVDLGAMSEPFFVVLRDACEDKYVKRLDAERQEKLAAEEAARLEREYWEAYRAENQRLERELAQAETERLRVAEVARKEQARLQAIADAAELEARTIREEQERLANKRQAAQQATDAEKLEDIAKRCASPSWPEMSEPWAHDIIHDEHVRMILAGLAMWIRGQVKEHQPKSDL